MTRAMRGVVLAAVQVVLVLTTAGKYLWERHTCPEVWTRVELFNEQNLRFIAQDPANRYMQVQLLADACSLPLRTPEQESDINILEENRGIYKTHPERKDSVRATARDGKLIVVESEGIHARDAQEIIWDMRKPCTEARLPDIMQFYVASTTAMPEKLQPGQTVWALVTVPQQGRPRPIELAISDATGFHPLDQR